jgi:deferrochelatase/peroxidase EfeB
MTAPNDEAKRGLYFICMNADIERQFEFVQQTWIDNPKFAGLDNDPDPLVAAGRSLGNFTVQASPVRERYETVPKSVTLVGGAYFFLPSRSALGYLGAQAT